jgi:hypothetical protein
MHAFDTRSPEASKKSSAPHTAPREDSPAQPFSIPRIQFKLSVNEPGDAYEQEADNVADQVMRMEDATIQRSPMPISFLQRKCAHCEDEEKLQRKEMNAEAKTSDGLESYVNGLGSGRGEPLPEDVRSFYEPRFGMDFSNVRVHTDDTAAKSASSVNALAFTTGNNIVFNQGQFNPETPQGKHLLAHELTHVVQQGGTNKAVQRVSYDSCSATDESTVRTAHNLAKSFIRVTRPKLWSYNGTQADVRAALQRHFHTTSVGVARLVADHLTHLLYMCDHVQYECHAEEYNGTTLAWSAWCVPFTDVLIYKRFFDKTDARIQANTLIHEWGHKYLCLLDLGYDHEEEYGTSGTTRALANADPYCNLATELGQ